MGTDEEPGDGTRVPGTATDDEETVVAAERLATSLADLGVSHVFANFGTDHAPILEAVAGLAADGDADDLPTFVVCPHEFVAMSAAHGYAAVTGEPQAVLVHVDVGTQNLGAAVHNAHRSRAPLLVVAGLAPVTEEGYVGSRNNVVQYVQDVFDQTGVVREYMRWTREYQPPADPMTTVARGLERSVSLPQGPTYLAATREALETPIHPTAEARPVRRVRPPRADDATLDEISGLVAAASAPLVVTSGLATADEAAALETLTAFAETAGAGVVEHAPTRLCFPRDHALHAGFDPAAALDHADLLLAVDTDVPWVPWQGGPAPDAPVVQIDPVPTKPAYPRWDFPVDVTVAADPEPTLTALTDRLDERDGASGRETWRTLGRARRAAARETVSEHRDDDRLTPAVVSATLADLVDEGTVLVNDATTSAGTVLTQVDLSEPGSYRGCAGSGLGWGAAAAVGVKLADPDRRVISLVGDGSYVFANPCACAWLASAHDAPTLTVVYNNSGWNAVGLSTLTQHGDGAADAFGVVGSQFDPRLDLAHPANVVDAHTDTVTDPDRLRPALTDAVAAVDGGTPAVVDVHVEPVSTGPASTAVTDRT